MLHLNDFNSHVNSFFKFIAIFFQLAICVSVNAEEILAQHAELQRLPMKYTQSNEICTNKINNLFENQKSFVSFYIPETSFSDEFGGQYVLRAFQGKTVVLYFWASWCMSCLDDLKALDRLKANATFRNIHNIEVVPVSVDFKELQQLKSQPAIADLKNLVLFSDKNKNLYGQFRVSSLPTTYIIDAKGNVVFGFEGSVSYDCGQFLNYLLNF